MKTKKIALSKIERLMLLSSAKTFLQLDSDCVSMREKASDEIYGKVDKKTIKLWEEIIKKLSIPVFLLALTACGKQVGCQFRWENAQQTNEKCPYDKLQVGQTGNIIWCATPVVTCPEK